MTPKRLPERLNDNFFSVASTGQSKQDNNSLTTEYVTLEQRIARPERLHSRVEMFQQALRQFALKILAQVQLCLLFLRQSTPELYEFLLAQTKEIETLWQEIELQQRVLINDSSLEPFHREQLDRYSNTAASLFLVSRGCIHLERFIRLADPADVFLVRTPLEEDLCQLRYTMVPVVEAILCEPKESVPSAQEALRRLEIVQEKHGAASQREMWKQHLSLPDFRLLNASLYALSLGSTLLRSIAVEYSQPLVPKLGGRSIESGDLLQPLLKVI